MGPRAGLCARVACAAPLRTAPGAVDDAHAQLLAAGVRDGPSAIAALRGVVKAYRQAGPRLEPLRAAVAADLDSLERQDSAALRVAI